MWLQPHVALQSWEEKEQAEKDASYTAPKTHLEDVQTCRRADVDFISKRAQAPLYQGCTVKGLT
jgi:hypothetical protein